MTGSPRRSASIALVLTSLGASLVLATACGDDGGVTADAGGDHDAGDDSDGAAPDGGGGGEPGYRTDLVGAIQLVESGTGGGVSVFAYLQDRPYAPRERRGVSSGDCALYDHEPAGECTPACDGFCNANGVCEPYPEPASAGDITITGLREALLLVEGDFGYRPEPYPLGDLFADDAIITAVAAGAEVDAFALSARGVAALEDELGGWDLVDGVDFPITWTPSAAAARVQLSLRIGWHGAPYEMMLLCETADDGTLTIPGELIEEMLPFGGIGLFPHPSEMTRLHRSVVTTSVGPVELVVGSAAGINWSHNAPN